MKAMIVISAARRGQVIKHVSDQLVHVPAGERPFWMIGARGPGTVEHLTGGLIEATGA